MSWRTPEHYLSAVIDGTEVVQGSPDRVAVYFTNFGAATAYLSTLPLPQPIVAGVALPVGQPIGFQWSLDGWLARSNFFIRGTPPLSIHVLEVLWYPDGEL